MDPFSYLTEIKLISALALTYFCYRKVSSAVYSRPDIEESESEQREEEIQKNISSQLGNESPVKNEGSVREEMINENDKEQSPKKTLFGIDEEMDGGKKRKWKRIRRTKQNLRIKRGKGKKNRVHFRRYRMESN